MHRNYENYIKIGKEKGPTINYHDECAREWSQIFSFIHIYRKCWKIQRCAKEKKFLAFAYFLLYLWMTRHNFGIVFRHRKNREYWNKIKAKHWTTSSLRKQPNSRIGCLCPFSVLIRWFQVEAHLIVVLYVLHHTSRSHCECTLNVLNRKEKKTKLKRLN